MKIIILSANLFGLNLIKYILDKNLFKIDGLITLNSDSNTVMYDGVNSEKFKSLGIKNTYFISRIGNEENLIKNIKPDLVIVMGWRQIIPEKILSIPKIGFIGFHPTKLPIGRGGAPLINSILNEYKNSGITLFKYTNEVDAGDIVFQEEFLIDKEDYVMDIYLKSILSAFSILKKISISIKNNKIIFYKQDNKKATFLNKITYNDNLIDRLDNFNYFYKKVRAFSEPYRGAYFYINNIKIVILNIKPYSNNSFIIKNLVIEKNIGNELLIENINIKLIIIDYLVEENRTLVKSGFLFLKNI